MKIDSFDELASTQNDTMPSGMFHREDIWKKLKNFFIYFLQATQVEGVWALAAPPHHTEDWERDWAAAPAVAHEDLGAAARLQTDRGGDLSITLDTSNTVSNIIVQHLI